MKTMTIRLTADQVRELRPIADTLALLGEGTAAIAQVIFTSADGAWPADGAWLRVGVMEPDGVAPVRELTAEHGVTLPDGVP